VPIALRPPPTAERLAQARLRFDEVEPGDLFYRGALSLIAMSRADSSSAHLDLAESLGLLLRTWNAPFYRFKGGFRREHLDHIRALLSEYRDRIGLFAGRTIATYRPTDEAEAADLFHGFELRLGPVGAAKALHLLAPRFFPLWDEAIAKKGYGITFGPIGQNSVRYLKLIGAIQTEIDALGGWAALSPDVNPIKAIDEYNYCSCTRGIAFAG
jgi:hypothetical protein